MAFSFKKKLPFEKREQSVPYKKPFIYAALLGGAWYLLILAVLTSIGVYFHQGSKLSVMVLLGLIVLTISVWVMGLIKRRSARCPLCKGTPFLNSGANLHEKAYKLSLLNHGNTNMVRTIFTQRFRCMYCGTPYDFLKPVSNPIGGKKH
jgi:hypothetical protein